MVTSAVEGMSVGEVRRCLECIRRQWLNANTEPFFITSCLSTHNDSLQTFALRFVKGQHQKRYTTK